MFRSLTCVVAVSLLGTAAACASNTIQFDDDGGPITNPGDGGGSDSPFNSGDGNVNFGDATYTGDGAAGVSKIYAHTDTELYEMDPSTKQVTDVGPFDDGSGNLAPVTDLAVSSAGDVWVNTTTSIFKATVPSSPGKVSLTKVADFKVTNSQKFYALGFATAGMLGSGETLVAGDNQGDLYAVESNGTLTKLGNFGTDGSTGIYELSGDVTFFLVNGTPRGLATVRLYKNGSTGTNDILAEIDVPAMTAAYNSKTPAASLKKQFLGSGTGYAKLYGVGAWEDKVYAFARVGSNNNPPAQLISIDSSGAGTVIQTFPSITAGWSGAGVTTSASVTVLPPN